MVLATSGGRVRHRHPPSGSASRRTLSRDELWRATSAWFDNDKQMYGELEDAYRFLFNEEPPVPTSAIDGRLWTTVEPWSPE